jgi:L-threonylcarbamoyladenylate synthase
MNTQVLKPSAESLALARDLLADGQVVALPTETVYGLAGDAGQT